MLINSLTPSVSVTPCHKARLGMAMMYCKYLIYSARYVPLKFIRQKSTSEINVNLHKKNSTGLKLTYKLAIVAGGFKSSITVANFSAIK